MLLHSTLNRFNKKVWKIDFRHQIKNGISRQLSKIPSCDHPFGSPENPISRRAARRLTQRARAILQ